MKKAYLLSLLLGLSLCAQNTWRPLGRNVMDQISPEGLSGQLEVYNDTPYIFNERKLSAFIAGSWQQQSPEVDAGLYVPDFIFDSAGTPLIAVTSNNSQNVSIMKLVSGTWQTVGNPILPVGNANNIMLAVSPSNDLYIGYCENYNAYDFIVKKLVGSNWMDVGNVVALDLSLVLKKLEFGADGYLYFAGNMLYNQQKPIVKRLNGNSWENVGAEFTLSKWITDFEVAPNGDALLMLEDLLFKYDGQWTQLFELPSDEGLAKINIGNDSSVFMTYKAPGFIGIDKVIGSNRSTLATFAFTNVFECETELDSSNNAVVAYLSPHGLNVIKSASGIFTQLGNSGINNDDYYSSALLMEIERNHNTPYVVKTIENLGSEYKIAIVKFDGTDWNQVGGAIEGMYPKKLLFDHWSRPYLMVKRVNGSSYASIVRLSGNDWQEIIPEQWEIVDMAIGPDDSLYLTTYSGVKKFNGVSWDSLGETIPQNMGAILRFYIGTDNIPRILVYSSGNGGENYSWQLKKLVGNSWQDQGESFTTSTSTSNLELATFLDDNNVFYYVNEDTTLKVMRLNGNQFEMLGQPNLEGIEGITTTDVSFTVNHTGTPYVSFAYPEFDPINGWWTTHHLSAYKFDGSSWVPIEDQVVGVGVGFPIIRINNNNEPVVVYNKNSGFYGLYYGSQNEYPLELSQHSAFEAIVAYPNPVSQFLYFKTEKVIECITIYDMLGKQIKSESSQNKVSVESLNSGMYFAKIKSGTELFTIKFSKK